ncbi:poly(rC)-binding protein 1-like [Hydractinia symbiolongicarpus]|uniref:poly(rC)-binding protein 1-like n=1 Tax=Hydractinia symbiolongicarpus TaxID=13093 RepID=UPI00254AE074|nr:poly(rC)-binding protein 1-like [Hydractinia symbiolongicarpus]
MAEEKLELHFIILSQDAGGIIGREGRNIRQMRDESGANINISGSAGVERILNIKGTASEIKAAVHMTSEKLQEVSSTGTSDYVPPVTMRLLVPNSQCGPLIGKGGTRIKEIREISGATITIPSETLPGSSERSVTLAGSPEALGNCVAKICEVFEEFPARQNNVQYYPHMFPRSMGPPQVSMMSGQLSFTGLSRRSEQRVRLPSSVIGSLIGKGGCHINEIRQFSGATVQVEESKKDNRMSDVIIAGTPEAVSCATFLINARISAGRQASRNRRTGMREEGEERRGRGQRSDSNEYSRE